MRIMLVHSRCCCSAPARSARTMPTAPSASPSTSDVAENAAADVGNTAQNIAADIGNDVKTRQARKIENRRRRDKDRRTTTTTTTTTTTSRTVDSRLQVRCGSRELQSGWSGRQDSNLRPSAPKADALPGCATPRRSPRRLGRIDRRSPILRDRRIARRWWARQDSNLQPSRYERPALPLSYRPSPASREIDKGCAAPRRASQARGNSSAKAIAAG